MPRPTISRPIPMARFDLGWPLAGASAAAVSMLVLGAFAAARGLPVWMPLNATTHAFHGAEAARTTAFDLRHTGLGAVIHIASCFFWAAVAVMLIRWAPRGPAWLAWLVGLATAAIAGLVDYGLMPAYLRPGWELVLPPAGIIAGLFAMGIGLSLGLTVAQATKDHRPGTQNHRGRSSAVPRGSGPQPGPAPTATDQLRQPAPHVLDQRQQRIDPAGAVTDDPNRNVSSNHESDKPDSDERSAP